MGWANSLGIDPDQPDQRRTKGNRRQRQRAAADPHVRAKRLSLRRQGPGETPACGRRSRRCDKRQGRRCTSTTHRRPPSIAVLRFENMSDDRALELITNGLTEDIIALLARVPGFFVIARASSFAY